MLWVYIHIVVHVLTSILAIHRLPSKKYYLNGFLFVQSFNSLVILLTQLIFNNNSIPLEHRWTFQVIICVFLIVLYRSSVVYKFVKTFESIGYYLTVGQLGTCFFAVLIGMVSYLVKADSFSRLSLVTSYIIYFGTTHLVLVLIDHEQRKARVADSRNKIAEDMVPIINQIRRSQHDYSNILSGLLSNSVVEEAYRSKVFHLKNLNQFESFGKVAPMIRSALYMKSKQLEEDQIEFSIFTWFDTIELYTVNPKEYEIVAILLNLINNAAEALNMKAEEYPHFKKRIVVKLSIEKGILTIKVGNSGKTIDPKQFEEWVKLGVTTKKEGSHGFGLYTIQSLCEKYKGRMDLEEGKEIDFVVVTL